MPEYRRIERLYKSWRGSEKLTEKLARFSTCKIVWLLLADLVVKKI